MLRPLLATFGLVSVWVGATALLTALPEAQAATPPAPATANAAEQRAHELAELFTEHPGGYEAIFAPAFLQAVPPAKIDAIVHQYYAQGGKVTRVRPGTPTPPWPYKFVLTFARGIEVDANLHVEAASPHRIDGLVLGAPRPLARDLRAIEAELRGLPGQVSFAIARLGDGAPRPLATVSPDTSLALGSAFKLFILGALVDDVAAGKHHWADIVALDERHKSLPSGITQDWPVGAPVTAHTLATLMISMSDNTATDHLLAFLGRERVERQVATMGVAHPERDRPLLSTRELFQLKVGGDPQPLETYLKADEAGRRAVLAELAGRPGATATKFPDKPTAIEGAEWFASASDMVRVLDWLRLHTEVGEAARARGVLAVNPGLPFDKQQWPYVGFKGGSEPGVLTLHFLLHDARGRWYALSAGWNDPAAALDEARFAGIVQRAAELIEAADPS